MAMRMMKMLGVVVVVVVVVLFFVILITVRRRRHPGRKVRGGRELIMAPRQ
jgi:uncharacterized membrane protein